MKILITTDVFTPTVNGVVTSVINLYTQLNAKGHDVKILTLSNSKHSFKKENVYYIKSFGIKVYDNARATLHFNDELIEEILDWSPDIIHSQCEFFTFVFAKRISKELNIPIVHTYHTLYEHYTHYFTRYRKLGIKLVSTASKILLSNVSTVIAPTEKVNDVLKNYGMKNKIAIIPTGIDLNKFKIEFSTAEIQELRKTLRINRHDKVLIIVGRLAKEKNIDELLNNMPKLILTDSRIKLLIVGDGPYRAHLEDKVNEMHLNNNVIFTGMINPKHIYKYYKLGHLFVSASKSETQGLTYLEALASNLPLVCKKDSCLNNVLINNYNGFSYETSKEYIEKIELILNNDKLYSEMSKNAYTTAEKYSTENFGKQVENVYFNELLQSNLYSSTSSDYYIKENLMVKN